MKKIFVVGFPRSGTTIVQQAIGSSPGILVTRESHFFEKFTHTLNTEK